MNKPSSCRSRFLALTALALAFAGATARPESLWRDNARGLVADRRAAAVGDILTIIVQETSTATKDNNTKTAKKSGIDASIASLFFSPQASTLATKGGKLPALKFDNSSTFAGGGSVNNSEKIVARVAVRVIDAQPNGNLLIEGTRQTAVAGETQDIILRGTVRPADILANNTVYSYNVADATIRIVAKGGVSDSQKKGWATRVWDKLSPF